MFLTGTTMFFVAMVGLILRWRGTLHSSPTFLRVCVGLAPMGPVAVVSGWITSETGRQPWIVYGELHTGAAVSTVEPSAALAGIVAFAVLYLTLLTAFVVFTLRIIRADPDGDGSGGATGELDSSRRAAVQAAQ